MFGLVRRSELMECERKRVNLFLEKRRVEEQLAQVAARADAQERLRADAERLLAETRGALEATRMALEASDRERRQLLEAVVAKAPAENAGAETAAPGPRQLTSLEVVARAMEHRNRHNRAGSGTAQVKS